MADSKKIDDGGLAFPGKRVEQVGTVADHGFSDDDSPTFGDVSYPGMSLRDYFAGQALDGSPLRDGYDTWNVRAKRAYAAADAMIAARKAGG